MIDTVRFEFRGAIPAGGRRGCKLTERTTSNCSVDDEGTPFFNFTMTDEESGARFMGLVHHTDAVREYAYDRPSLVGQLDKAWDEALRRHWTIVDMKNDWKIIYPFELR